MWRGELSEITIKHFLTGNSVDSDFTIELIRPFHLILVQSEDLNESLEILATSVLYSFDLKICQCGFVPNGKLIFVDTWMFLNTFEPTLKRILKYQTRITQHKDDCKPFCSTHFESVY